MLSLAPYYHLSYGCRCNVECFYCYERGSKEFDRFEAAESVVAQMRIARDCGYQILAFASGELLLHPEHKTLLREARDLGFREIHLVTNLTSLHEEGVQTLAEAGVDVVAGTLLARDDKAGFEVTSRHEIWTRQKRAIRLLREASLALAPHFLLTRSVASGLLEQFDEVTDLFGKSFDNTIVSAIEPIRGPEVRHPQYFPAQDLDWPGLFRAFESRGTRLVTQNVPACRLGPYAHRNWRFQRRLARAVLGFPKEPSLRDVIARQESLLARRDVPETCREPVLCQNTQGIACDYRWEGMLETSVRVLLSEFGLERTDAQVKELVAVLERLGKAHDLAEAGF